MEKLKNALLILLGCAVMGLAYALFLIPHHFVPGGVSGIAIIANYFAGLPVGAAIIVLNVPIFLLGLKTMGKKYVLNSLAGMVVSSVLIGGRQRGRCLAGDQRGPSRRPYRAPERRGREGAHRRQLRRSPAGRAPGGPALSGPVRLSGAQRRTPGRGRPATGKVGLCPQRVPEDCPPAAGGALSRPVAPARTLPDPLLRH